MTITKNSIKPCNAQSRINGYGLSRNEKALSSNERWPIPLSIDSFLRSAEQAPLGGVPDQLNAGRMVFSPEEDKQMRVEQLTANLEAVRIGMRLINAPHDGPFNENESVLKHKALFTMDRDAFHSDYMALALHFGALGEG